MATTSSKHSINPRLGRFFGIFASFVASLVILALIFEQLGSREESLDQILLLVPVGIYGLIAFSTYSSDPVDFFASGRRVPAFFNGLSLTFAATGATGLVALTGLFYLIGFDAFAFALGLPGGVFLMAVLVTPYLRKHGCYTLPGFFAHRFQSRSIRFLLAFCFAIPAILIVIAELQMLARVGALVFDLSRPSLIALTLGLVLVLLIFGGMRAQTWSSSAQALVALFGALLTLFVVATIETNLPVPQVTYATTMKYIARADALFDIAAKQAGFFDLALPGSAPQLIAKPYNQPFGAMGMGSFVLLMLVVMFGVAGMPALATRCTTSVSVYEARKSAVWAVILLGILVLMIPAVAVFARYFVFTTLANIPSADAPAWLQRLSDYSFAFYDTDNAQLTANKLSLSRDGILMMLPMIANMPHALVTFTATGIIAAGLACISLQLLTLSNTLAEDVVIGLRRSVPRDRTRLIISRIALIVVTITLGVFAATITIDPLWLMLWAMAIAASSVFPALAMAIWWKRCTKWGIALGTLAGLAISITYIYATAFLGMPKILGLDGVFSPLIAVPISAALIALVSLVTPKPGKAELNIIRDIRVPGGETYQDREERLARVNRRRKRQSA